MIIFFWLFLGWHCTIAAWDVLALSLTALWLKTAITLQEMLHDRLRLSAERKGAKVAARACSAPLVSPLADLIVSLAQPDCAPKLVNYSHGSNWLIDGAWLKGSL